jgi:hypothetical protein
LDRLGLPARMRGTRLGTLVPALRSDKKRAPARGPRGAASPREKARHGRGVTPRDGEWHTMSREVRWVLTPRIGHASVPRLVSGRLLRAVLIEAGARP